jgi:hypothetical protein
VPPGELGKYSLAGDVGSEVYHCKATLSQISESHKIEGRGKPNRWQNQARSLEYKCTIARSKNTKSASKKPVFFLNSLARNGLQQQRKTATTLPIHQRQHKQQQQQQQQQRNATAYYRQQSNLNQPPPHIKKATAKVQTNFQIIGIAASVQGLLNTPKELISPNL